MKQKEENPDFFHQVLSLFELMKEKGNWTKKLELLKKMNEYGSLDNFITMLIKQDAENGNGKSVEEWIKIKQLLASNITQENALRY